MQHVFGSVFDMRSMGGELDWGSAYASAFAQRKLFLSNARSFFRV